MANVGFKMGTQDALDALLKLGTSAGATDGTFYLTSNTNRLYIGKSDGSIAPVNEGVITVDNVDALKTITAQSGAFYYAKAENVLCVRSGNNWVQINAIVTNKSLSQVASNVDGGASLQTILLDSRDENVNQTFKVKGDGGITVTGAGDTITVTGDPLTLSTSAADNVASATFKAGGAEQTLQIGKGNDNITIGATGNKITISSKDTYVNQLSHTNAAEGFTILGTTNAGDAIGGTTINPIIKVDSASTEDASAGVKFKNGVATLPVYTVGEVNTIRDNLTNKIENDLKAFNAMEYKGTVGTASTERDALPVVADNVKNGYSYLVSGSLTYGGTTYPAGTLVVASGTEDASSGYLTDIRWSFVTGSTADTTYSAFITTDGALNLQASTGGDPVAIVNVVAGNEMEVAKNAAGSGSTQVYTVNHKAYDSKTYDTAAATDAGAMNAVQTDYEIEAITGITVTNGHITGVTSKKYTVKDTNVKLTSTTASVAASNNVATVTHTTILTNGAGDAITSDSGNASFVVESSSLEITANTNSNGVVMNLVWGSF